MIVIDDVIINMFVNYNFYIINHHLILVIKNHYNDLPIKITIFSKHHFHNLLFCLIQLYYNSIHILMEPYYIYRQKIFNIYLLLKSCLLILILLNDVIIIVVIIIVIVVIIILVIIINSYILVFLANNIFKKNLLKKKWY